jgi:hypothetical protein
MLLQFGMIASEYAHLLLYGIPRYEDGRRPMIFRARHDVFLAWQMLSGKRQASRGQQGDKRQHNEHGNRIHDSLLCCDLSFSMWHYAKGVPLPIEPPASSNTLLGNGSATARAMMRNVC